MRCLGDLIAPQTIVCHTQSREFVLDTRLMQDIDFGDVILHVFNGPVRDDYDLERMWPDAPRMELEDKPAELYGHFELDEFGG